MRKSQSIMEIAIAMAVVAIVLLLMGGYVQRGLSGKVKENIDSLGGQYDPNNGNYFQISRDKGYSTSFVRVEKGNVTDGSGNTTPLNYQVTYQAAGPNKSVACLTDTSQTALTTGSSVAPLTTDNVEHFEADWQNLTDK